MGVWQIAVWTLMLIALLGPHTSWSICLTGICIERVETVAACCSCCHDAADGDAEGSDAVDSEQGRGDGDGENRGDTCPGCCLDLALAIDEAPLPKPVSAPNVDHEVAAILPPQVLDTGSAVAARYQGHDTGPPRVDRRTALIATTILRE